ncbi:MAG: type I methionyl aminopeptidase [candidate division KSB1 bacterium]|jgi:methionyl aminopeptidase|nr:type I methionyl aminopeptidase [candidate division KSB1 bacterium]
MIIIKSQREIEIMRESASMVVGAFDVVEKLIKPGITSGELDEAVESFIKSRNAIPSFKGYSGYPASICASIDEQVVHGIPGDRRLEEGEIISVDIGVEFENYHGDAAKTFAVGEVSEEKRRLMAVTREALYKGIDKAIPGNRLSDISHAVQVHVEAAGFSVVRDLVGHGIGRNLHEEPQIPNYGKPNQGPRLKPGMVFAIEPMVNMGGYEVKTLDDNWTVVTIDGLPSAHFEHTIAITDDGPDILTLGL